MLRPDPIQAAGPESEGAIVPSPDLSELLRKHAAKEPLSFREAGRVGAHYRNLRKAAPAPSGVAPGADVPALPAHDEMGEAPGLPPLDPEVVKGTVRVVLEAVDSYAVGSIRTKAREAGADQASVNELAETCSLKDSSKALMVEPSPIICEMMGLDPRYMPIGSFLAGLATWGASYKTAMARLEQIISQNASSKRSGGSDNPPPSQP